MTVASGVHVTFELRRRAGSFGKTTGAACSGSAAPWSARRRSATTCGVLGIRFSADQAAQTQDVDGASFERLSVVLQDQVEERLAYVFGALKFEPVLSVDPGRVWR